MAWCEAAASGACSSALLGSLFAVPKVARHAPQKQPGTRETLKGPATLTARAKRVGVFNDKQNALKPNRELDSPIVARGKTTASKRVKGRTG